MSRYYIEQEFALKEEFHPKKSLFTKKKPVEEKALQPRDDSEVCVNSGTSLALLCSCFFQHKVFESRLHSSKRCDHQRETGENNHLSGNLGPVTLRS